MTSTMTSYTINDIQDEMRAAGSHWWDPSALRFFKSRISDKVYQGDGGVYFVSSERYDNQPRKYTVREYRPESQDIATIGEFNSLTRNQAHKEAKELAGDAMAVVDVSHQPVSDSEQLAVDIDGHGGHCSEPQAAYFIRLATGHHKAMEDDCNGVSIYDEDGEPLPTLAKLRLKLNTLAEQCHLKGVQYSGDPRGCTVKLIMPDGETNDFGKEGWCVPTSS